MYWLDILHHKEIANKYRYMTHTFEHTINYIKVPLWFFSFKLYDNIVSMAFSCFFPFKLYDNIVSMACSLHRSSLAECKCC